MLLKKKVAFALLPLFLVFAAPAVSLAQGQQISLGTAVKMAEASNVTLAQDQVNVSMDNNNAAVANGFSGIVSSASQLQDAELTLAADENNIVCQTEADYFAVQDAVYAAAVAGETMKVDQDAYNIAQVEESQGIDTPADVSNAKSTLEQDLSQAAQAKTTVNTAYVDFDNIVGLDPTARPDLTSTAVYDPNYNSGLADVQDAVAATLKNNPNVQIALNAYNVAVDMQALQSPVENQTLDLQSAGLAYQQTVQSYTATATSAFLAVSNDQGAYNAQLKAQAAAQATYDNDLLSYKAGMVSHHQLLEDEAGLMSANQKLQVDLHTLLEGRANLAQVTGVGSVNVPVNDSES